jgi:hypothetical protein
MLSGEPAQNTSPVELSAVSLGLFRLLDSRFSLHGLLLVVGEEEKMRPDSSAPRLLKYQIGRSGLEQEHAHAARAAGAAGATGPAQIPRMRDKSNRIPVFRNQRLCCKTTGSVLALGPSAIEPGCVLGRAGLYAHRGPHLRLVLVCCCPLLDRAQTQYGVCRVRPGAAIQPS